MDECIKIFEFRQITGNTIVFYNNDQSICGEIRLTHDPNFNIIALDKHSEPLTEEQRTVLSKLGFPYY